MTEVYVLMWQEPDSNLDRFIKGIFTTKQKAKQKEYLLLNTETQYSPQGFWIEEHELE